jgi:Rps23 Pro-64 3,4-dihydroxylase Tpa1-like proline 4-hydroxylase
VNYNIADLILDRLKKDEVTISEGFNKSHEFIDRFVIIDNLLPNDLAQKIFDSFPNEEQMRLMKSFRETKFTSKNVKEMEPIIGEALFAFQDERVVKLVEKLTGLKKQNPDPFLYAGGISLMKKGHFLNPHIDNSHDKDRKQYRTLNLLYYVTPGWQEEFGGNLELWDDQVLKKVTIPSLFNRLVLMETNAHSWHSVSPVLVETPRACVSNYYFSPDSPSGHDYFHITAFSARPEQLLVRAWCRVDTVLRSALRLVVKKGIGPVEINK